MGESFHLFPSARGCGVLQKTQLAPPQFVPLPIGDRQLRLLFGDAVPQVFDKLKAFGPRKLEERRKFGIHECSSNRFSGSIQQSTGSGDDGIFLLTF